MSKKTSSLVAKGIKYIFVALTLFYVLFIWKIPMPCNGCEATGGLWYRCIAGTGLGTDTCTYSTNGGGIGGLVSSFSQTLSGEVSAIVEAINNSGFVQAPKAIIQRIVQIWNSIVGIGNDIVNQIKGIFTYVSQQISIIINEYIIGSFKTGYGFIRDNVIIPIIQGISNYIINPVKSLIEDVVVFKDDALKVLQNIISAVKGYGSTVYDFTYGLLIEGFDQIPYGLVLFVEGIQSLLNYLKTKVIGFANDGLNVGVDVSNAVVENVLGFAKIAMTGTQSVADTLTSALNTATNFMIENVVNRSVGALNTTITYDLGSLARDGVNTLIGVANTIINGTINVIVNPLIGVADTVQSGFITAVNGISGFDMTGWIPSIDLGITEIKIPSFKPFGFIPNIGYSKLNPLPNDVIKKLDTNDIPVWSINNLWKGGVIPTVPNIGLQVPDFAGSSNAKLSKWVADAHLDYNIIKEPEDLFWAGKKVITNSDEYYPTGSACSAIAKGYNFTYQGNTYNYSQTPPSPGFSQIYDQYKTGTCYFSAMSDVNNGYLGSSSCSDVCYQNGNLGTDTTDTNGACGNQYFIYGSPESNAIPSYVTPGGLTIYMYKNQPTVYFAPNLYRLEGVTADFSNPSSPVFTETTIQITKDTASTYSTVPNGGFMDKRTNTFYVVAPNTTIPQPSLPSTNNPTPLMAWNYKVNIHNTASPSSNCNVEYLLTTNPESLGITSIPNQYGMNIYSIDNQSYIYLNPKLYQISDDTPTPVTLEQLTGVTTQYSFISPYNDRTPNQTVKIYKQYGYKVNTVNYVELPTQYVNNVAIPLSPTQVGYTVQQSKSGQGAILYYTNSAGTPYYYLSDLGRMLPIIDFNTPITITGTTGSNGYTLVYTNVYSKDQGQNCYIFVPYSQTQYYILLEQVGYEIDVDNAQPLAYKTDANCNPRTTVGQNGTTNYIFNIPSDQGYIDQGYLDPIVQPGGSTIGTVKYYRKNGINYLYDNLGNVMIPIKPYSTGNLPGIWPSCTTGPSPTKPTNPAPTANPNPDRPNTDPYPTFEPPNATSAPTSTPTSAPTAAPTAAPTTAPNSAPTGSSALIPPINQSIWGVPVDNGYSNELFGYSKGGGHYFFVVKSRKLIQYYSKDLYQPTCLCSNNQIATKTCSTYCSSTMDSSNANLGCDDNENIQKTGYACADKRSLLNPINATAGVQCACTKQGPVNIIVKPMQEYNPFRLLQKGVKSAYNEMTNVLKSTIQSFLTPVWNTIRGIFQYIISLFVMIFQFIAQYLSPSFIVQQIKTLYNLAEDGFTEYVWRDGILFVVNYIKDLFQTYVSPSALAATFKPVTDFFKNTFIYVVQALGNAFKTVSKVVAEVVTYVAKKTAYFALEWVTFISKYALFFLPIDDLAKTIILVLGGIYFAAPSTHVYIEYFNKFINSILVFFSRIFGTIVEVVL